MAIETARRLSAQSFGEVRAALVVARRIGRSRLWLAGLAALISVAALIGYLVDYRPLYVPMADAPATHPLTAIAGLLLAVARLLPGRDARRQRRRGASVVLAGLAAAMLVLRGLEVTLPSTPLPIGQWLDGLVVPDRIAAETRSNFPTALTSLAVAIMLPPRSSLGLATVLSAIAVCGAVLVGYGYGMHAAVCGMSPIAVLITLLLAFGTLQRHLDPIALRLVMAQNSLSRVLRRQLGLAICGFWFAGLLVLELRPRQLDPVAPLFVTLMLVLSVAGLMSTVAMLARAENARQRNVAALQRMTFTDPLTRLANRRAAEIFGRRALAAAQRDGAGLAVVLIDIDRFKRINDRHGHAEGDRVLRDVGALLPRWLRGSDLAVRWGGEEFLLILSAARLSGAQVLAERLRQALETQLQLPDGTKVTASLGCAELLPGEDDLALALLRADAAMYRAKTAGRNRVEPALAAEVLAQPVADLGWGQPRSGYGVAGLVGAFAEEQEAWID